MGPEFRYPSRDFELWAPLYLPPQALRHRQDFSYLAVARLKPGVTREQARRTWTPSPPASPANIRAATRTPAWWSRRWLSAMAGPVRTTLWVLLAAVGTLFLIGCANLAALLLARAARPHARSSPSARRWARPAAGWRGN